MRTLVTPRLPGSPRLLAGLVAVCALGSLRAVIPHPATSLVAARTLGGGTVYFVEHGGQVQDGSAFYTEGRDLRLDLGPLGATLTLHGPPPGAAAQSAHRPGVTLRGMRERMDPLTGQIAVEADPLAPPPETPLEHRLNLEFIAANAPIRPVGRERTPTVVSYFRGSRAEWRTGLATYREVLYPDLWPGVDLVFRREAEQVKYRFVVRPGADPRAIRLAWRGASALSIDASGALLVANPVRDLRDEAPTAYQSVLGRQMPVSVRYALAGADSGPDRSFGFALGAYDPRRELVIDPAFFAYAGFFGRAGSDRGLGIAVDGDGSAYFCGQSASPQGDDDAYVVKVSADGTHYVYVAFLGGAMHDTCFDIGVDPAGSAYLTGVAGSSAAQGFPVTMGPDLTHNGGGDDTLVAKLDPSGTGLIYAGFLGSNGFDFGEGIRVAPDGSAYLSGIVSAAFGFPLTVGPDLTFNGSRDAYICKLKPLPSAATPKDNYDYCGYIGGAKDDIGRFTNSDGSVSLTAGHVAIDDAGYAYLSGMTQSDETTFPDGDGFGDLPGPDRSHNGDWDAWVAKVRADGSGLVYAGFLGGAGQDEGYGAGVDASGAFYFAGSTMSGQGFPAVVGPDLSYNGGISDAFVAKVAADGSRYAYAGFIGGACQGECGPGTDEMAVGLTADAEGHAYPIGWTYGAGTSFPTVNGPDPSPNGVLVSRFDDEGVSGDAWVGRVRLDPSAAAVTDNFDFLGFVGGDRWDAAFWIALDDQDDAYVVGDSGSSSASFPDGWGLASRLSPNTMSTGGQEAFVVKLAYRPAGPTLTPEPSFTPQPAWTPTAGPSPTPTAPRTPVPTATLERSTKTPWPPRATTPTPGPSPSPVAPHGVYLPNLAR